MTDEIKTGITVEDINRFLEAGLAAMKRDTDLHNAVASLPDEKRHKLVRYCHENGIVIQHPLILSLNQWKAISAILESEDK